MIATVTLNPSIDTWIELPSLRLGALNRVSEAVRSAGGKGINVSRVIQELRSPTRAFGIIGGHEGVRFRKLLRALSIPSEMIAISGSTRNNYKIRTLHPRAVTELNTAGPQVSLATVQLLFERLLRHQRLRCVVLSGSLPPGIPLQTYQHWIQALRTRHLPTVLDASGDALRLALAARPWLIKPNREEAEELLGEHLTGMNQLVRAVGRLLELGPEVVMLSLDADGALLGCGSTTSQHHRSPSIAEIWLARPPKVTGDSSVGAGDSLLAGVLVRWAAGASWPEALRCGVACGAAAAMTPGAELCRRSDVERLLPRVTVRRLA